MCVLLLLIVIVVTVAFAAGFFYGMWHTKSLIHRALGEELTSVIDFLTLGEGVSPFGDFRQDLIDSGGEAILRQALNETLRLLRAHPVNPREHHE